MAAARESAALAGKLTAETSAKPGITRGQLSLHAGHGTSMTSKPAALLPAGLGVTPSRSRPHVSNGNPYPEAQFKTLRYRPASPARFPSTESARAHGQDFFRWHNNEHRHGGPGPHTASDVHHSQAAAVQAGHAQVLTAACQAHPQRSASRPPTPPDPPATSRINPPQKKEDTTQQKPPTAAPDRLTDSEAPPCVGDINDGDDCPYEGNNQDLGVADRVVECAVEVGSRREHNYGGCPQAAHHRRSADHCRYPAGPGGGCCHAARSTRPPATASS